MAGCQVEISAALDVPTPLLELALKFGVIVDEVDRLFVLVRRAFELVLLEQVIALVLAYAGLVHFLLVLHFVALPCLLMTTHLLDDPLLEL